MFCAMARLLGSPTFAVFLLVPSFVKPTFHWCFGASDSGMLPQLQSVETPLKDIHRDHDWWFGTFVIYMFHFIYGIFLPIDFHIFRG